MKELLKLMNKSEVKDNKAQELLKSFYNDFKDLDAHDLYNIYLDGFKGEDYDLYGGYDPDNTNIMNAIYELAFNPHGDITIDNLGTNKEYRGDTMNSFKSLMGGRNDEDTDFLGVIKNTDSKKTKQQAEKYFVTYHTVGNMLPLPNNRGGETNKTLNLYRGTSYMRDYFDLFLQAIKDMMLKNTTEDNEFEAIYNANAFFFNRYQGLEGFQKYCDDFMLNDYIDENGKVLKLFSPHIYHWKKGLSSAEYSKAVDNYTSRSTNIINNRAIAIVKRLKTLYTR